jgi:hypothetical protein
MFPEVALFAKQFQRKGTARQATQTIVVVREILFSVRYKLWCKKKLAVY